jgi:hypothetical protein
MSWNIDAVLLVTLLTPILSDDVCITIGKDRRVMCLSSVDVKPEVRAVLALNQGED